MVDIIKDKNINNVEIIGPVLKIGEKEVGENILGIFPSLSKLIYSYCFLLCFFPVSTLFLQSSLHLVLVFRAIPVSQPSCLMSSSNIGFNDAAE